MTIGLLGTTSRPPRTGAAAVDRTAPSNRRVPPRAPRPGLLDVPGVANGAYWVLLTVVVVGAMVGLVMVLSSSGVRALNEQKPTWSYFRQQAIWVTVGAVAMLATLRFGERLRRLAGPGLLAVVVMLVLVLVPSIGLEAGGARRWLGVGQLQVQPSEVAKLALIIFVANLVARQEEHLDNRWSASVKVVRPAMAALTVVAALVLAEPNLGTTVIIAAIVFAMLFAAGAPGRSLAQWALAALAVTVVELFRAPYRRGRLMAFRNPWAESNDLGFQTLQSLTAIAGGGLTGRGLGESRAKWSFLPEAHTDFIYAVMAEEFGLVGAVFGLALFVVLATVGIRVASRAPSTYDRTVAVGITTWFVVQAFINVGAVVGLLPITGVPLPFVSFGGSSLLVTMAAAGILLNIARRQDVVPSRR